MIAELKGPEESFVERLFTKIRQVRYFDDEEYFQATKMQLERKDGEPAVTVAIWGEGVSYLLPNVKLLAIVSDPPIFVPAEAVWELAGANCRALDDANVLVESIEGDEWLALIERARLLSVTP